MIKQFTNIKDTLDKNVETIRSLLSQAQSLSELAESIKGTTEEDKKIKAEIEVQVDNILSTVSSLFEQSEKLFKMYNDLAENMFKQ